MILQELISHGVSAKSSGNSESSKGSMISFLEPKLKVDNNNKEKMKSVNSATATLAIFATTGLPEPCPLVTGGAVPDACRFHPKLFARLITEGVLPTADGCPILKVCKLRRKDERC